MGDTSRFSLGEDSQQVMPRRDGSHADMAVAEDTLHKLPSVDTENLASATLGDTLDSQRLEIGGDCYPSLGLPVGDRLDPAGMERRGRE